MKNLFRTLLLLLTISTVKMGYSQTPSFSPKGSFSIDLGVPARPKNLAFERVLEGLLNAGIDYRYNVYNGLTIGAGLKYGFFTINPFAFNNTDIGGGMQMPGAYLHLGYEKFTTERVSFSFSARGGYSLMMAFNDSCRAVHGGQHINSTYFFEPQVEMVMLTDKNSPHGFSMVLGYAFYFHEFKSEDICVSTISELLPENYEGITRFWSIGFGYRHYLGRQ
ncbi:MAG: hypothetical protein ACPG21_08745 [Crocinitomicaceae bacterium]